MNQIETTWATIAVALPLLKLAGVLNLSWGVALSPVWIVPVVAAAVSALIALAIVVRVLWLGVREVVGRMT